jgi:hypothetical protein
MPYANPEDLREQKRRFYRKHKERLLKKNAHCVPEFQVDLSYLGKQAGVISNPLTGRFRPVKDGVGRHH